MKSIKAIFRRGQHNKIEGQNLGDNLPRASSVTNLEAEPRHAKGAKPMKNASRDRIDKIGGDGKKSDKKGSITRNNNKLETGDNSYPSVDSLSEEELLQLRRQLQEMAQEKTNLALQLGEHKGQLHILHKEIEKLKEESNLQLEHLTEENTLLRNRLRDVAHSPLSDNEKQQLLFESHRHHSSAPASIATNIIEDGNGGDTTCTTPDWDKHSSSNVSEVSVACLQDKINQMQETHYSTNEELQATLQELTDLQRQLTELQQENERLNEEKSLMFDSLCRQTERLNDSRSEVESLKQLFYQEKDDTGQFETAAEREQKLVDLLKSAQEERESLMVKLEQINNEIQESRSELIIKDDQIGHLRERVKTLECTLDAKHAEHKLLDQELAQAKDQCSGKQIEINRLSDLLDNARTKINELEQDRALSDKSELDELLDNARKEKDSLESEVAHLKEQLAISKNEIEKLREQVSILQEECKVTRNNAKTTQSDLEYKCEKLVKEKNKLNEQLQEFQEALNELQVQSQCQLEDKRQLSAVLSETQRNLSESERKNLALENELEDVKRQKMEENEEWEKFQEDLLTSVRVANDFKTEVQQELQRMILENKSIRDSERQLKAEIEKLKGGTLKSDVDQEKMDLLIKRPNRSKSRQRKDSTTRISPQSTLNKNKPQTRISPQSTLNKNKPQKNIVTSVVSQTTVKRRNNPSLKTKRLKTLSVEEEMLLQSLNSYYTDIDKTLPDEFLTEEQKVIRKLKIIYEDDFLKVKPIAPKPKDQLAISKPLLDSVLTNPKLMSILNNPKVKTVEDMAIYEKEAPEIRNLIQDIDRSKKGKSENFAINPTRISVIGRSMSYDNLYEHNTPILYRSNESEDLTKEIRVRRRESSLVPSDSASNYNRYSDFSLVVNNNEENLTLENIIKSIPKNAPISSLTKEQKFALKLKQALEERKNTLKKLEKAKTLPISTPTPDSVLRNPKLKEIIHDPDFQNIIYVKSTSDKNLKTSKSYDNINFNFEEKQYSVNVVHSDSSEDFSSAEFNVETGEIGPYTSKQFIPTEILALEDYLKILSKEDNNDAVKSTDRLDTKKGQPSQQLKDEVQKLSSTKLKFDNESKNKNLRDDKLKDRDTVANSLLYNDSITKKEMQKLGEEIVKVDLLQEKIKKKLTRTTESTKETDVHPDFPKEKWEKATGDSKKEDIEQHIAEDKLKNITKDIKKTDTRVNIPDEETDSLIYNDTLQRILKKESSVTEETSKDVDQSTQHISKIPVINFENHPVNNESAFQVINNTKRSSDKVINFSNSQDITNIITDLDTSEDLTKNTSDEHISNKLEPVIIDENRRIKIDKTIDSITEEIRPLTTKRYNSTVHEEIKLRKTFDLRAPQTIISVVTTTNNNNKPGNYIPFVKNEETHLLTTNLVDLEPKNVEIVQQDEIDTRIKDKTKSIAVEHPNKLSQEIIGNAEYGGDEPVGVNHEKANIVQEVVIPNLIDYESLSENETIPEHSTSYDYHSILRENRYGVTSPLNYRLSYKDVVNEIKDKFEETKSDENIDDVTDGDDAEKIELRARSASIDKEMEDILENYLHTRVSQLIKQTEDKRKKSNDTLNFSDFNITSPAETPKTKTVALENSDQKLDNSHLSFKELSFSDDSYFELKDGNVKKIKVVPEDTLNLQQTINSFLEDQRKLSSIDTSFKTNKDEEHTDCICLLDDVTTNLSPITNVENLSESSTSNETSNDYYVVKEKHADFYTPNVITLIHDVSSFTQKVTNLESNVKDESLCETLDADISEPMTVLNSDRKDCALSCTHTLTNLETGESIPVLNSDGKFEASTYRHTVSNLENEVNDESISVKLVADMRETMPVLNSDRTDSMPIKEQILTEEEIKIIRRAKEKIYSRPLSELNEEDLDLVQALSLSYLPNQQNDYAQQSVTDLKESQVNLELDEEKVDHENNIVDLKDQANKNMQKIMLHVREMEKSLSVSHLAPNEERDNREEITVIPDVKTHPNQNENKDIQIPMLKNQYHQQEKNVYEIGIPSSKSKSSQDSISDISPISLEDEMFKYHGTKPQPLKNVAVESDINLDSYSHEQISKQVANDDVDIFVSIDEKHLDLLSFGTEDVFSDKVEVGDEFPQENLTDSNKEGKDLSIREKEYQIVTINSNLPQVVDITYSKLHAFEEKLQKDTLTEMKTENKELYASFTPNSNFDDLENKQGTVEENLDINIKTSEDIVLPLRDNVLTPECKLSSSEITVAPNREISKDSDDLESLFQKISSTRISVKKEKPIKQNDKHFNEADTDRFKHDIVNDNKQVSTDKKLMTQIDKDKLHKTTLDNKEKADEVNYRTLRQDKKRHVILYTDNKSDRKNANSLILPDSYKNDHIENRRSPNLYQSSDQNKPLKDRRVKSFAQHFEKLTKERVKYSQYRKSASENTDPIESNENDELIENTEFIEPLYSNTALPTNENVVVLAPGTKIEKKPIPAPRSKNQVTTVTVKNDGSTENNHEVLKMSEYEENFSDTDRDDGNRVISDNVASGTILKIPKKGAVEVPGLHSSSELLLDEFSSDSTDDDGNSVEEGVIKKSDKFLSERLPIKTDHFAALDVEGAKASYSVIAVAGTAEKLDLRKTSNVTIEPSSLNLFNLDSSSIEENYIEASKIKESTRKRVSYINSKYLGENSDTESFDEDGNKFYLLNTDSKPKIVDFVPLDEATEPYYKNNHIPDYSTLEREKTFQVLTSAATVKTNHPTSPRSVTSKENFTAAKKLFQDLEAKTEQSGVMKVTLTKKKSKEEVEAENPTQKKKVVKRSKLGEADSKKPEVEEKN